MPDTLSAAKPADACSKSSGGTANRRVFLNFAASIAASWIASPLGVIFLHLAGYGADPNLVSLLLMTTAAAPFQLLCNEYLAAIASKSYLSPTTSQLAVIVAAQIVVTFIVGGTFGEAEIRLATVPRVALCVMLATSTWLSYIVAVRYYAVTLRGEANYRHSIIVGALPGVVTLLLSLVTGFSHITSVILLAAVMPSIGQFLYVGSLVSVDPLRKESHHPSWGLLIVATILLAAAAAANAQVRGEIGFLDQRFVALILTGLNLAGTMVLMVSRASYLTGTAQRGPILMITAAIFGGLSLMLFPIFRPAALLLVFLGLQLGVAAIIALLRKRDIPFAPLSDQQGGASLDDPASADVTTRMEPR